MNDEGDAMNDEGDAMNDEGAQRPGRQCLSPECTTVLSIYNSDHLCFTHADAASRARFERTGPARTSLTLYHQRLDPSSLVAAATS